MSRCLNWYLQVFILLSNFWEMNECEWESYISRWKCFFLVFWDKNKKCKVISWDWAENVKSILQKNSRFGEMRNFDLESLCSECKNNSSLWDLDVMWVDIYLNPELAGSNVKREVAQDIDSVKFESNWTPGCWSQDNIQKNFTHFQRVSGWKQFPHTGLASCDEVPRVNSSKNL